MGENRHSNAFVLGLFIFLGLSALGYLLGQAAIEYRLYDRSVTVKGLSEREYEADIVIWPIQFNLASNNLKQLYDSIDSKSTDIQKFLVERGIPETDITFSTPAITDKIAQQYGNNRAPEFRYSGFQTVTVYSNNIATVHAAMGSLSELGKKGIVFIGSGYDSQTEYLFTRLNEVKPEMIEEATRKARHVAEKFAADSDSQLGKIKKASQGQFSIYARDRNNPHIKKVRVVATVQYYLSD